MGKFKLYFVLGLILLLLLEGASAAPSTTSPAKIVTGFLSNSVPAITKWVWSLKATTRTAVSGKSMMKFESGYSVETVFDGSKLGIEPYAVEVLHNGELLILDSDNSNIYRISSSLSLYSRPKLVTGSAEGYSGHVDGKLREARMNHPKGITVDDRGNVYVADTMNMAIRKISDTGVTTIAGGKWSRGGSHVDGPSEEAKFSNDFDVFYVRSSCSILVIDRGNQAIREIQLHFDDCAYQYGSGFPLGIAMLVLAVFFGYLLALLQHRLSTIVAAQDAQGPAMSDISPSPYQKSSKSYRPILIPSEDEPDKQDEGLFGSIGKLLANAMASVVEIMGGLFPGFRSKPQSYRFQRQPLFEQPQKQVKDWSVQESFVIPDEDEPPSIDTRSPTPRKTYPFMSKDAEKMQELWRSQAFYTRWNGNLQQQQQKHNHHHQYHSSIPHTYYEQSHEATNEILFGAVQEQEYVVVKPVNYGDSLYDNHNIRSRISSVGDIHKY
ncbi:putative six-bladed beta-propeller, TolB [Lupinus albus]|uniref:Putative six-bladed beta-propeller, TolB n=1 Tax=Lupinus albus TaxID=3870 RepID=A0A6A4Q0R0_LUPAL|nr:putative six-bladed beta-propeller, TolB [Lupinus albus]